MKKKTKCWCFWECCKGGDECIEMVGIPMEEG